MFIVTLFLIAKTENSPGFGQLEKQIVVYLYDRIVRSNKKGQSTDTCNSMAKFQKYNMK